MCVEVEKTVDLVLYKYLLLYFCLLKFYKRPLKESNQANWQPKPQSLLKTIKPLSTNLMCGWEISRDGSSNCAADQHKGQTKDSLIKMSFRTVALELLNVSLQLFTHISCNSSSFLHEIRHQPSLCSSFKTRGFTFWLVKHQEYNGTRLLIYYKMAE